MKLNNTLQIPEPAQSDNYLPKNHTAEPKWITGNYNGEDRGDVTGWFHNKNLSSQLCL